MLCDLKIRTVRILLVMVATAFFCPSDSAAADSEHQSAQLQIRLRPVTKVMHPNVRLTDIATFFQNGRICTLSDLPRSLQIQLHQVPVARLTQQCHETTVAREELKNRIQQLRNLPQPCELIGPKRISVSIDKPSHADATGGPFRFASAATNARPRVSVNQPISNSVTDLSLEQAIRDELARQFGLPADDLQVRLLRNVISGSFNLKDVKNPVVQVTAPAEFPYGRHSLVVRILDGQRIAMMQSVSVDVRQRQSLLMTKRPVAAGAKIEESMLREEIRFTDRQHDQLRAEDVVGMTTARSFRANEIVSWNHLRNTSTVAAAPSHPIVNVRDAVHVIAKRKGMTIVIPSAEALQSGRKGQLIRVRNVRSNKVISARVIGPGAVELVL